MQIKSTSAGAATPMGMAGAKGVSMRVVFSRDTGAPTFAMRSFEVEPGGFTPRHRHPYEHEVYIMEGEGVLDSESGAKPFHAGDAVFVAPDELHQFKNTGNGVLKFLCMVPAEAQAQLSVAPSCEA